MQGSNSSIPYLFSIVNILVLNVIFINLIYIRYYFVGFYHGIIVLAQKYQPHKIRLLNPLTKTWNTMFEAQMPSVIQETITVLKSPTMIFAASSYPSKIAWVDQSTPNRDIDEHWGEGIFSIVHHAFRCLTEFNGHYMQ